MVREEGVTLGNLVSHSFAASTAEIWKSQEALRVVWLTMQEQGAMRKPFSAVFSRVRATFSTLPKACCKCRSCDRINHYQQIQTNRSATSRHRGAHFYVTRVAKGMGNGKSMVKFAVTNARCVNFIDESQLALIATEPCSHAGLTPELRQMTSVDASHCHDRDAGVTYAHHVREPELLTAEFERLHPARG